MLTASKIIEEVNNGRIFISDFDKNKINPNSYNVTLNKKLLVYTGSILSTTQPNETKEIIIPEEGYVLKAGEFYLGATNEVIGTDYYVPKIDGRSSLGRLGLLIHYTAGFGDIGFKGTFTLEISSVKDLFIKPNMEIGQVSFDVPYGDIDMLYTGRYQNQVDPTASKYDAKRNYFYSK